MNPQTQKSTAVATQQRPSALALMASRISVDPNKLLETLKATCFRGATNDELLALVVVANTYDLNPILREIYAFPSKGGGITPIIGVDGFVKMMNRQPEFDGIGFEYRDEDGGPYSCTATIHCKSRKHPVVVTEYYSECYRKTDPWDKMPRRMLRNRALCQAARVAFGFSGVFDEDEASAFITVESAMTREPLPLPDNPELEPMKQESVSGHRMTLAPPPSDGINIVQGKVHAPSIHMQFSDMLVEEGFTVDEFLKWAGKEEHIKDADSVSSIDEIDGKLLVRLFKARVGVVAGLKQMKGIA